MARKNQEMVENHVSAEPENEKIVKSQRPEEIDLKVRIQAERDFMIAKALNEGRASEVFDINNLPDERLLKQIREREQKNRK